ncbi:hypothetical protein APHAL10511_001555 [Amanita phalloides]|nr:hypothetical protein APHAL10511_001555 [Amanita phalloides]
MSRLDAPDFDHLSRLSVPHHRTNTIGDNANGYNTGTGLDVYAQHLDRRPSLGLHTYAPTTSRSFPAQEREYGFGTGDITPSETNRRNSSKIHFIIPPLNTHRPSPPLSQTSPNSYSSSTPTERDAHTAVRNILQRPSSNSPPSISTSRSSIYWGDLEPWMDEEYAKQVCTLMGWDPINIRVPRPPPDPITGQQPNNPGYCFLTFPTPAHAASVLAQINNGGNGNPTVMPNSSKPFTMNWAANVPSASPVSYPMMSTAPPNSQQVNQYQKEYSIFVGDLAPEASNSDLVAVFRNPVLGLRNDREPKFIRPFLSCKSAKIMLDPVTGVSRGYGFVRFTDEADQQRALIEMHGLYCLSRPMRISPATAKYKPPAPLPAHDFSQVQYSLPSPVTLALPLHNMGQSKNAATPMASVTSNSSLASTAVCSSGSGSTLGGSNSGSSLSSGTAPKGSLPTPFNSLTSEEMINLPNSVLAQIAQQYANSDGGASVTSPFAQSDNTVKQTEDRYAIPEESWKHHAQARAILGNLIGPNGEQLTSTDPYNTTVFVGGLSPLISEETLRTFFAPFGDIHYVKVPAGKHCGFVQFVRKADAERAIEKMQGFPIGGSRIRLSWGRSQYKAAQAAAQAAQAAALQAQYQESAQRQGGMTQEQALQILQKFTLQGYLDNPLPVNIQYNSSGANNNALLQEAYPSSVLGNGYNEARSRTAAFGSQSRESYLANSILAQPDDSQRIHSNFSPFSPDPNYDSGARRNGASSYTLPQLKVHAPEFLSLSIPTSNGQTGANYANTSQSPSDSRSSSAARYGNFFDISSATYSTRHPEVTISRASSGSTSAVPGVDREGHDSDLLQDLNGTLASLDLDREKPQTTLYERNAPSSQSRPEDEKSIA